MEILKIVLLCILSVLIIIVINNNSKEQAMFIRIATSILLIFILTSKLTDIISEFKILFNNELLNMQYFKIILKVIAIAYLSEFASDIAKDAGENTISTNTLIAGKILIIYISSPLFLEILNKMTNMMNF